MHLDFLYELIGQYGLYAVFILAMVEGDITLLLAGVLAHSYFFGLSVTMLLTCWGADFATA
jgi:membrane protein DedA with SNARE-associated domain